MTAEEMDVAIAGYLGWKFLQGEFTEDQNAMYVVEEEGLLPHHFRDYERNLRDVHLRRVGHPRNPWHYSAAVRAEAFLRTVGKWEEETTTEKEAGV